MKLINNLLYLISTFLFFLLLDIKFSYSGDLAFQVNEKTTKKNLTYWYLENHDLPTVSMILTFKNLGYSFDEFSKQGLSELSLSTLSESCKSSMGYDLGDIKDKFNILFDLIVKNNSLQITINTLTENLEHSLDFLSNLLMKTELDRSIFSKKLAEQLIHANIIKNDPYKVADQNLIMNIVGKHPYSYSGLGNANTLMNINFDDAVHNLENKFNKNNIKILIVGDVKTDVISDLLDKYLSVLPDTKIKNTELQKINWPPSQESSYINLDIPQSIIAFAIPHKKISALLYEAEYSKLEIMSIILNNLMFKKLRENLGTTYSPNVHLLKFDDPSGDGYFPVISGFVMTDNKTSANVIKSIHDLLDQIKINGINENIFHSSKAKAYFKMTYMLSNNLSAASLLSRFQALENKKSNSINTYMKILESVTFKDMNLFIQNILSNKNQIFVEVGKENHMT